MSCAECHIYASIWPNDKQNNLEFFLSWKKDKKNVDDSSWTGRCILMLCPVKCNNIDTGLKVECVSSIVGVSLRLFFTSSTAGFRSQLKHVSWLHSNMTLSWSSFSSISCLCSLLVKSAAVRISGGKMFSTTESRLSSSLFFVSS